MQYSRQGIYIKRQKNTRKTAAKNTKSVDFVNIFLFVLLFVVIILFVVT